MSTGQSKWRHLEVFAKERLFQTHKDFPDSEFKLPAV